MMSSDYSCFDSTTFQDIQNSLHMVVNFLKCYLPLSNAHVNDFLVCDVWNRIVPSEIQQDLFRISDDSDIGILAIPQLFLSLQSKLLENKERRIAVLKHLEDLSSELTFSEPETFAEDVSQGAGLVHNKMAQPLWCHSTLEAFVEAAAACTVEVQLSVGRNVNSLAEASSLSKVFVSHGMSEKKAHEIELMSDLCASMCQQCHLKQVVDIGSGKGYLGASLHLEHSLSVLEIDAQSSNSQGALKRRDNLIRRWPYLVRHAAAKKQKQLGSTESETGAVTKCIENDIDQSCISITAMVNTAEELDQIVNEHTNEASYNGFLFTGLHTCGGLSSTILRSYVKSSNCAALANVGCCYHLLEETHYRNPFLTNHAPLPAADFPMSNWLSQLAREDPETGRRAFALGRNARVLASQCLERILQCDDKQPLDISMFHRVVIQRVFYDHLGYTSNFWVVGKHGRKYPDFNTYTRAAAIKFGFPELVEKLTDEVLADYLVKYAYAEKQIFLFYMLRCVTASAIESCILLDRLLYLKERERASQTRTTEDSGIVSSRLVRLFQPKQSPRCYALLSTKRPLSLS